MRCSWCEVRLDEYLEGGLAPRARAALRAHLEACAQCRQLLERARIVDGLLHTNRPAPIPADFTAAVMVRVRAMPAPAPMHRTLWHLAAAYLVGAWAVVAAALLFVRFGWSSAQTARIAAAAGGAAQALTHGLHSLWPAAPIAASLGVTVLSIDVMLLAAIVVFYRMVRPRLAAVLAPAGERP